MEINNKKLFNSLIAVFFIFIFFIYIFIFFKHYPTHDKSEVLKNGTLFSTGYKIEPFNLIDENGNKFTLSDLKGHWNILFFGFTRCPMMCPVTLSELSKAYTLLKSYSMNKNIPKIIFISVDSESDNPKIIKNYLNSFNANFIGLTGDKLQINHLAKQLGVFYEKIFPEKSNSEISHSGALLIVNPEGRWVGILNYPHHAETIAEDLKRIQNR